MVEYNIIKEVIYKSFDENTDSKCNDRYYDINTQEYNTLKGKINTFVDNIKQGTNKTRELLETIKNNFKTVNSASDDYDIVIRHEGTDKFDQMRQDWERKYPDIPFGMDVPSYNERMRESEKAIDDYIKTTKKNEKLLEKYSTNWIDDLDTTGNYKYSREHESRLSSFIKDWKKEVKNHLGVIRGLPTFKSFDWNQDTKNEYIKECNKLLNTLDELDRLIYHKN